MKRVARYLAVVTVAITGTSGSMVVATPVMQATAPMQQAPTPQRPVFTADVEMVRLSVAVFDSDDVPVADLGIQDFSLAEDGIPREISLLLTPRDTPLDICFVPFGFQMGGESKSSASEFLAGCARLEALGVTWLTVAFPARSRQEYIERVMGFGDEVLSKRS